ncbi:MAG TPA: ABC transporter permease [Sulfurimonas autotrophica]|nr:ABC transporter permease [Sulfurimonas autotrophica]
MNNNAFLNFLFLSVYKHRSKHIAIFIISTLLILLLASMTFISSSLQHETRNTLKGESDFIIQKIRSGRSVDAPTAWMDEISEIRGVSVVAPRIYGKYLLPYDEKYFTIIGVDFFDEQIVSTLKELFATLDIKAFLREDQMIIGQGVKAYMHKNHYKEYFNFITPIGEQKRIGIYKHFPDESNLISNDIIVMSADSAREILGIDEESVSDISIAVPNEAEWDNIAFKLKSLHFDARIIAKTDMQSAYEKFYNYKSGIFLLLFILSLSTFMLILYQRYAMVGSSDKKEIAILRMLGWSIKDVLKLKLYETLFIGIFSFLLGVVLAYVFVFVFNAPLLRDIFLGFGNLANNPTFQPLIDGGLFASLFLFFILPFIFAVIIPVWRIAIIDPYEGMK